MNLNHVIVIEKHSAKKLQLIKVSIQVHAIKKRILAGGRENRWKCEVVPQTTMNDRVYRYAFNLKYLKPNPTQERMQKDLENVSLIITKAARASKWRIVSIDGKSDVPKKMESGQEMIPYAPCEIDPKWSTFYTHIYDRENQIEIILSRIQAAIDSDWVNRFHIALVGEPAGGKTEVARSTRKMLGDQSVLELDATATTQAGVIKELSEREELPRVIIIEEIEKSDFKQLPWLLGMLDPRAEIRKLNFRSKILFEMKGLCIATINNYKLFTTVLEGALSSRFGDPIFFPRPSSEILRKILKREVEKIKGNMKWIEPTIRYCMENDITDPRSAQAICLSGKNALLDGSYQAKLQKVRMPK